MMLQLAAVHPERAIEVDLHVAAGETVALIGPNGAGKSSVLAMIAGLLRPDQGRARVGDQTLFDTATGLWLPPHARSTALLAQDPLLFPHLSVLDNVAFGPRAAGVSRRRARARAERWLDAVEVGPLRSRRPGTLSGGQAQRVSIARALAAGPAVLLLDEPMAALDVTAVPAMRHLLRRVLSGRTAIIVTHDVLDALVLADRVLVVEHGRVVEQGPTTEVLSRPRSAFAAKLADLNLSRGIGTARGIRLDDGTEIHAGPGDRDPGAEPGTPVVAAYSPRSVALHLRPPGGSPRNALPVRVRALEPRGGTVRVHCDGPAGIELAADVTAAVTAELALAPGDRAYAVVKAMEVATYPAR